MRHKLLTIMVTLAVLSLRGAVPSLSLRGHRVAEAISAYAADKGAPPVAHWRFDESGGPTAYDASGNGNSGTLNPGMAGTNTSAGQMWTRQGKIGGALECDETDDYVSNYRIIREDGPFLAVRSFFLHTGAKTWSFYRRDIAQWQAQLIQRLVSLGFPPESLRITLKRRSFSFSKRIMVRNWNTSKSMTITGVSPISPMALNITCRALFTISKNLSQET